MSQLTHAVRRSPRRARLTAAALLMGLVAFMLVWIGRASADEVSPAATISKTVSNVATTKADGVDETTFACLNSQVPFVGMPGMTKTFKLGGRASQPVIVLFQGEWDVFAENTTPFIRLAIDGIVQSGPDDVGMDKRRVGEQSPAGTRGFNFISDPLAPGFHTATIEWRVSGGTPRRPASSTGA